MNEEKLFYQIALTKIDGIGRILGRNLVNLLGDEKSIFTENARALSKIPGIGQRLIQEIKKAEVLKKAEKEVIFVNAHGIRPLFFTENDYPSRLKECIDMPLLLYFKGNADLNAAKIISMVGTRRASAYGKWLCEELIAQMKAKYSDILIVSGLAYGIDIHSHRTALKENIATVAVLAHGLDRIYPYEHRKTASAMLENGGLITEYPSGTNPDKYNFVTRNSIIAGMSDATIVVESAEKGGSLITADIANVYDRDVFAAPGRINDESFKGCLNLIKKNKASLFTSLSDLEESLGWNQFSKKQAKPQQLPFVELSDEETVIMKAINEEHVHINQLVVKTNIPIHQLSFLLLELEFKNLVRPLPGGMYKRV